MQSITTRTTHVIVRPLVRVGWCTRRGWNYYSLWSQPHPDYDSADWIEVVW